MVDRHSFATPADDGSSKQSCALIAMRCASPAVTNCTISLQDPFISSNRGMNITWHNRQLRLDLEPPDQCVCHFFVFAMAEAAVLRCTERVAGMPPSIAKGAGAARSAMPAGRPVCLACTVANNFQLLTPDGKRPRLCASHDPGRRRRPKVERPRAEAESTPSEVAARLPAPSELATLSTAQAGSVQRGRAPTAEELGSHRIDSFLASGANPRRE